MALPEFNSEAEFREQWVGPFLTKLGYVLVTHTHGPAEQGRDFFFADFDRFEHLRFYAAQVKNGDIGAGDIETDKLLNQVRRSFEVQLRYHKEAERRRICAVYVMASGTISHYAREYISDFFRSEKFGENVYFLDGERLERLDQSASQSIDTTTRAQLVGLLKEATFNIDAIQEAQKAFGERRSTFVRSRHSAVEAALINPPASELIVFQLLQEAWIWATALNKICDHHLFPFSCTEEEWEQRRQTVHRAWDANLKLRDGTHEAIKRLDARLDIQIEFVE